MKYLNTKMSKIIDFESFIPDTTNFGHEMTLVSIITASYWLLRQTIIWFTNASLAKTSQKPIT